MGSARFKENKSRGKGNSQYITTHADLKYFTKQVDEKNFSDKRFEKAYKNFKRPVQGGTDGERI